MREHRSKNTKLFGKVAARDLICPSCRTEDLVVLPDGLLCSNKSCECSSTRFPFVNKKPALIDFRNSLMYPSQYTSDYALSVIPRIQFGTKMWLRDILRGSNRITAANIDYLVNIASTHKDLQILIIGGAEVGDGIDRLYKRFSRNVLVLDIYDSPNVDILADAHSIPFRSGIFDIVIIQAVLEHVLNPEVVVSEISRVLRDEGTVYAETPFMQQVHEGPYDFTRYTESGHRYLFRSFSQIRSGITAGAGSSLLWALDFFCSGLFRTRLAGKLIQVCFFWLRYFDRLIPETFNVDAACGVYFIGTKNGTGIENKSILLHYQGNQRTTNNKAEVGRYP